MDRAFVEQQVIQAVHQLSDGALEELATFIDHLRNQSGQHSNQRNASSSFLNSVANLGHSGQSDISARDEEILSSEIHPIHGWNLKPDEHA